MTFGKYIKEKRIEKEVTLRQFCKLHGFDPSNWSKTERGLLKPPSCQKMLRAIKTSLGLSDPQGSYMIALAAKEFIPKRMTEGELVNALPVFVTTTTNEMPDEETLEELYRRLESEF